MKIAVTGGTGFIGKYLVRELSKDNEIIVLAIEEGEIPSIAGEKYYHTDYSKDSLKTVLSGCDAIVHMAGVRSPQNKSECGIGYYSDNITVSDNIFSVAAEKGIANIVMLSTQSVYNGTMEMPLTEDKTSPFSLYGVSKLMAEDLSVYYNRKYGMKIKQLRLAQVLGIGERKNLMSVYLEKSVNKETLPVYGKGISTKTYIYVKDVVRAVKCAIEHPKVCGAFNIAMDCSVTNARLAQSFCEVFGNDGNFVFLPEKKEDGEIWSMDNSKAKEKLGFYPRYTLKDALTDMRKIIQEDMSEK